MGQPSARPSSGQMNAGSGQPPCTERDTTMLSPSREIITSEFPSSECRNKSVARSGFALTGWERTHRHAWWEGTHRPPRTRGDGSTGARPLPTGSHGNEAGVFVEGLGWRVGGSRVEARSPAPPCRNPQRCHGGSSPPPTGPLRPRGGVTKFVELHLGRGWGGCGRDSGSQRWMARGAGPGPASCCPDVSPWDPPILRSPAGREEPEGARGRWGGGGAAAPPAAALPGSRLNN